MFGQRVTLFRLSGIAVKADASWLIVVVLVTWSLASGVFPAIYKGHSLRTYWAMAIAGAIVFFASIVVHELSHALVARRFGIPMKSITLFVFGGVAEMDDEPPNPRSEFLMAAAGPAASFLIGFGCMAVGFVGDALGWRGDVLAVIQYLGFTNFLLAAFNLIPAFPLDGGRLLRSLIWWKKGNVRYATRISSQSGSVLGLVLIVLGFYALFTGNLVSGLWWFLIGMFIRQAAGASYQQVVARDLLRGQPVSRFMTPDPVTVPRGISVAELVDDYFYRYHHRLFPVVEGERLVGCVTTRQIRDLPREEWSRQTVGTIALPCDADTTIPIESDAMGALTRMSRSKSSGLVVVDGERAAGVLTLQDLLRALSLEMELSGEKPGRS